MSDVTTNCVLLADSHHGLIEGLRGLLETSFASVFMVGDERSLMDGVERLRPDLTIVDLALAGSNWLVLLREIHVRSPKSKLIVLSLYDDESVMRAAMAAGVDGFVLKRAVATDMLEAAATVLRGDHYVSPGVRKSSSSGASRDT